MILSIKDVSDRERFYILFDSGVLCFGGRTSALSDGYCAEGQNSEKGVIDSTTLIKYNEMNAYKD